MNKFIAIEGVDGTGKATQTKLLKEYLESKGNQVATFSFPRYGEPSARLVEAYLQGELGTEQEVGPYAASMCYAIDRFKASDDIRKALEQGKFVICDRYVGSNMAHQGQKIHDKKERLKYFDWNIEQEFDVLNIPKPDISIVLTLDPEIAQKFAATEDKSGKGKDIHDSNIEHLKRSADTYRELCELFPNKFIEIDCSLSQKIASIDDVHKQIIQKIGIE